MTLSSLSFACPYMIGDILQCSRMSLITRYLVSARPKICFTMNAESGARLSDSIPPSSPGFKMRIMPHEESISRLVLNEKNHHFYGNVIYIETVTY